jgi:hypothetical protein
VAPYHGPGRPAEIERSTMMLPVAEIEQETSVAASPGTASTGIVVRLVGGSVRTRSGHARRRQVADRRVDG